MDSLKLGRGVVRFDQFDNSGFPTGLKNMGKVLSFDLLFDPLIEFDQTKKRKGQFKLNKNNKKIQTLFLTSFEIFGQLDFVSSCECGPQWHFEGWNVKLFPERNVSFPEDEWIWDKQTFEFEMQKDVVNHPEAPWGLINPLFNTKQLFPNSF